MSFKIVFFDIDGTLVNEHKVIPEDTKQAIVQLRERGVEVVIATGRAPFHLKRVADELNIRSYISFNGSYVVWNGQPIYERPISESALSYLETTTKQYNHPLVYLSHEKCHVNQMDHPHVQASFDDLKLEMPAYHPAFYKESKIYQALLYCQEHEEQYYQGRFPEVHLLRWHRFSMDVLPSGGSKAIGVKMMLQQLGLSREQAVAFGDGLNDREMLSFVGMGIAMGNAVDLVKPHARFTTKNVDEGGISHGLKKIGLID